MLSDPNVKKICPKVGNRYEAALAISRRARDIAQKRYEDNDPEIKDPVDIAAEEIAEGKAFIKIKGEYVIEPDFNQSKKEDKEEITEIVKE